GSPRSNGGRGFLGMGGTRQIFDLIDRSAACRLERIPIGRIWMRTRFFDFAHVLIGKPVPTFPGHALMEMIGGFGFAGSFRLRSKRSAPGYSCLAPWKDRGERSKSRCSSQ